MGEIRRVSLARGKRVIKVAPVSVYRDPETVAAITVLGVGPAAVMVLLTDDERRALIEALGGELA